MDTATDWFVYLLRCADNTLYTGITTDLQRRLAEHNGQGRAAAGARYTRSRRPVTLVWCEAQADRAAASRREHELKQLSRAAKERLLAAAGANGLPPAALPD